MKERPILFQRAMVRALLAGTKMQTRRVLSEKHQWHFIEHQDDLGICPYGQPGDRLWVRETFFAFGRWETRFSAEKGRDEWHFVDMTLDTGRKYHYDVADPVTIVGAKGRGGATPMWWKRPAIFMPRPASRLLLDVAGVRVERLQAISDADAQAEGCPCYVCGRIMDGRSEDDCHCFHRTATATDYRDLWESINGPGSWDTNPWVWAVEFLTVAPGAANAAGWHAPRGVHATSAGGVSKEPA